MVKKGGKEKRMTPRSTGWVVVPSLLSKKISGTANTGRGSSEEIPRAMQDVWSLGYLWKAKQSYHLGIWIYRINKSGVYRSPLG